MKWHPYAAAFDAHQRLTSELSKPGDVVAGWSISSKELSWREADLVAY